MDLGCFPEARYLGEFGRRYLRNTKVNACIKCSRLEIFFSSYDVFGWQDLGTQIWIWVIKI